MLNIIRCRHLGRSLEILRILPEIFEPYPSAISDKLRFKTLLISGFHLWTRVWRAELSNGAVKKINLVVEIDD